MSFDWDGLYNPFFAWRCSTRDPAAIYHDGKYYIYLINGDVFEVDKGAARTIENYFEGRYNN